MLVNKLFDKMWDLCDEGDNQKLLEWIEKKCEKQPKNIDNQYVYLDVLGWIGYDNVRESKEPAVIQLCTEIIKDANASDKMTVAKAYTYRGEMRFYAIDRRKDFDKATSILNNLDKGSSEVKFLKEIIAAAYPLNTRQYLFLDFKSFRNQI